jgi:DNA-directed RNA polymerase subunit M/transcription elongation factor TFIIS
MKFCDMCHNMLYVGVDTIDDKKKLVHYCKTCGHRVVNESSQSVLVLDDNKVSDVLKYSQYVNKFIKYDPCLPRVNNIECTNTVCSKPKEADHEVIYIKYDNVNMKYVYYCCHCDFYWTNNSA